MKKIFVIYLTLALGIAACEPLPNCQTMIYLKVLDGFGGAAVTEVNFPVEGGKQTIYVETLLPYWMARPTSLNPMIQTHNPDVNGWITIENIDGWMTIKYRHSLLSIFSGEIGIIVEENSAGPHPREDGIYIWNDDIPASLNASVTIKVVQE